jgi:hypothetical protein
LENLVSLIAIFGKAMIEFIKSNLMIISSAIVPIIIFIILAIKYRNNINYKFKFFLHWPFFSFEVEFVDLFNQKLKIAGIDDQIIREVIKKMAKEKKYYHDYILLRYGPSVEISHKLPTNFYYCVLKLGCSPKKDKKDQIYETEKHGRNVELVYKDYIDFVFSVVAGMPSDHAILSNCMVISGNKTYIEWVQYIKNNLTFDECLISKKLNDLKNSLYQELATNTELSNKEKISILYNLGSIIIQKNFIDNLQNEKLNSNTIKMLSEFAYLKEIVKPGEFKDVFIHINTYFTKVASINSQDELKRLTEIILKYCKE